MLWRKSCSSEWTQQRRSSVCWIPSERISGSLKSKPSSEDSMSFKPIQKPKCKRFKSRIQQQQRNWKESASSKTQSKCISNAKTSRRRSTSDWRRSCRSWRVWMVRWPLPSRQTEQQNCWSLFLKETAPTTKLRAEKRLSWQKTRESWRIFKGKLWIWSIDLGRRSSKQNILSC